MRLCRLESSSVAQGGGVWLIFSSGWADRQMQSLALLLLRPHSLLSFSFTLPENDVGRRLRVRIRAQNAQCFSLPPSVALRSISRSRCNFRPSLTPSVFLRVSSPSDSDGLISFLTLASGAGGGRRSPSARRCLSFVLNRICLFRTRGSLLNVKS